MQDKLRVGALAVAIGLVLGCSGAGAPPSAMPTATPTRAPTATPRPTATPPPVAAGIVLPADGQPVSPGTYVLTSLGFEYRLTVPGHEWLSLAPDWGVIQGDNSDDPPDLAALALWGDPKFVYLDPCQWTGTEASTGSSAQEWAEAIGQIDELSPSEPTDVFVGGHIGKRITITVLDTVDTSQCAAGEYRPYEGRTHIGASQIDDIWIVGLPGGQRRVIVTSYFPDTPVQLRGEIEQMMALMTIEPE